MRRFDAQFAGRLGGQTVLVTGGGSGMGLAMAMAFVTRQRPKL